MRHLCLFSIVVLAGLCFFAQPTAASASTTRKKTPLSTSPNIDVGVEIGVEVNSGKEGGPSGKKNNQLRGKTLTTLPQLLIRVGQRFSAGQGVYVEVTHDPAFPGSNQQLNIVLMQPAGSGIVCTNSKIWYNGYQKWNFGGSFYDASVDESGVLKFTDTVYTERFVLTPVSSIPVTCTSEKVGPTTTATLHIPSYTSINIFGHQQTYTHHNTKFVFGGGPYVADPITRQWVSPPFEFYLNGNFSYASIAPPRINNPYTPTPNGGGPVEQYRMPIGYSMGQWWFSCWCGSDFNLVSSSGTILSQSLPRITENAAFSASSIYFYPPGNGTIYIYSGQTGSFLSKFVLNPFTDSFTFQRRLYAVSDTEHMFELGTSSLTFLDGSSLDNNQYLLVSYPLKHTGVVNTMLVLPPVGKACSRYTYVGAASMGIKQETANSDGTSTLIVGIVWSCYNGVTSNYMYSEYSVRVVQK